MKRNIWLMAALLSLASMKAVAQQPVVHFDMSLTQDGKITESGIQQLRADRPFFFVVEHHGADAHGDAGCRELPHDEGGCG